MEELKTAKGIDFTLEDYSFEDETVSIGRKDEKQFAIVRNHYKRNGYFLEYKIIVSEVAREDVEGIIEAILDEMTFYVVCRRNNSCEFKTILALKGYNSFQIPEGFTMVGSSDTLETAVEIKKKMEKKFREYAKIEEKSI